MVKVSSRLATLGLSTAIILALSSTNATASSSANAAPQQSWWKSCLSCIQDTVAQADVGLIVLISQTTNPVQRQSLINAERVINKFMQNLNDTKGTVKNSDAETFADATRIVIKTALTIASDHVDEATQASLKKVQARFTAAMASEQFNKIIHSKTDSKYRSLLLADFALDQVTDALYEVKNIQAIQDNQAAFAVLSAAQVFLILKDKKIEQQIELAEAEKSVVAINSVAVLNPVEEDEANLPPKAFGSIAPNVDELKS